MEKIYLYEKGYKYYADKEGNIYYKDKNGEYHKKKYNINKKTNNKIIYMYNSIDKKYHMLSVNKIIYYTFNDLEPKYIIKHIDGDKINNKLSNLYAVTPENKKPRKKYYIKKADRT